MHPARAKWIGLAIFLAIIAEFVLDLNAPVGTSVWIGYLLPLLLSTYVGNRFFPLVLAAILSALTLIAAYQSPPGSEIHLALANRCLGIAALAATAWFIFERKRSEQGAARARRALVTITDCNQALVRAGNEADLLHDVCRIIVESGGYPLAWVGFSEHDDECSILPAAWAGKEGAYLEKIRISWGDNERGRGPTGTAVRTGKVTICHDLANDPNLAPWREQAMRHGFGSSIVLPLLDGSTVFGALSIYSSDVRAFDAPEEKLLTELANDLAYGVLVLRARHDQQHAREKLRQSEQLYHSVVTAMAEGMVVQGVDGRIIAVNPAAEQIQGRTMAEMLGRTSDDPGWDAVRFDGTPFPGEEHPAMMTLRTGRSQSNVIMGIRQPGGERRWLSINSQPLRSAPEEPPYAVVTTFHDITEIRRAEEQIREQAQLLELAQDAIIVRDLQNRILYWNKGAERIYGWSAGEVLAKPFGQLLHIGLFEYEQARKAVMERGEWRGEMNTRSKGGLEVLIEARWTLVRDAAGAPKSVLAICTDITEKKKLENQFYRAQRLESLGTMASGIAHDLNNILTPLLVSVQLLKEKVKDDDGEKLLANLEIYVRRGAGLVRQVLSFGRGVEGERFAVQPGRIAREIEQIVHETFPKSIQFQSQVSPHLWSVVGDPNQLHQVLLNLCLNARDAMPEGGRLTVSMDNLVVDEIAAAGNPELGPGSYVCITVADTGVGISRDIQDKIFEPFFTTKPSGKGTGLGLSTSLGIVKSHGGFIHCSSDAGKGCTFKVYLPADVVSLSAKTPAVKAPAPPGGRGECILVVDDEAAIREIVSRILELQGYRVLTAANGAEAVSLYAAKGEEIAAVITDMAMPVMDGPAAITALKSINPRVRIIAASGLSLRENIGRAADAGVRHFIPKPFSAETLLTELAAVLREKT